MERMEYKNAHYITKLSGSIHAVCMPENWIAEWMYVHITEAHSVNCINLTHYYHQRELHLLASFKGIAFAFHHGTHSNRPIRCHVLFDLMRSRKHLFICALQSDRVSVCESERERRSDSARQTKIKWCETRRDDDNGTKIAVAKTNDKQHSCFENI